MATAPTAVDTIQGMLSGDVWFHLDVVNDILYLRRASTRNIPVFGEETTDGSTRLVTDDGIYAGLTVTRFWRRNGRGDVQSATFSEVSGRIAAWADAHNH